MEINYTRDINFNLNIDTIIKYPKPDSSNKIFSFLHQEVLDSSSNKIHVKRYYTDSLTCDKITTYYQDSIVKKTIMNLDTIKIENSINSEVFRLKHNQKRNKANLLYKTENLSYYEIIYNIRNNCFIESAYITSRYFKFGSVDTVKYSYNKISKVRREYAFNPYKKEWFIKEKIKYNKNGQSKKLITQFYHNYHRMYFKTQTNYFYNKYGLVTSEKVFDLYLKVIEKKIFYEYE
jgi:hypothetical protein